jgi:hypothetical protein
MVALRVSLLYLGMVWYDNIKDDIRDDIYQRSTKYVHIPTVLPLCNEENIDEEKNDFVVFK